MDYEKRLINLLDKLIENFEKLQEYFARKYILLEDVNAENVIHETFDLIKEINDMIYTDIPLKNTEKISRRVVEIIKSASAANNSFELAKLRNRVTIAEKREKKSMLYNLEKLSNKIIEYNKKVKDDQKIITVKKALKIAKKETKKINEKLCRMLRG